MQFIWILDFASGQVFRLRKEPEENAQEVFNEWCKDTGTREKDCEWMVTLHEQGFVEQ